MLVSEVALFVLGCLGAHMLLFILFPSIQRKWFSWFYSQIAFPMVERKLLVHKEELFRGIKTITSKDPELREEGAIRVLEIGLGQGVNLQFYSDNCRLIGVDINANFKKYFEDRKEKLCPPGVKVEKLICCSAEDMKEIPDNSVDVVVGTYVFCSVPSRKAGIAEIKRVLAPGGRYFFLEHVMCPAETSLFMHLAQDLLCPFFIIFFGCRLNRTHITPYLVETGFSSISRELRMIRMPWFAFFASATEMGYAVKVRSCGYSGSERKGRQLV